MSHEKEQNEGPKKKAKARNMNKKSPSPKLLKLGLKKRKSKAGGVIYLGRIPHGFYEDQITDYFSQFGKVISAVVPRSKKTGRSKGYAFVEFQDEEVAKIAAETMNNYLMYNKILQCRYIPLEERKNVKVFQKPVRTCPRVLNRIKDAKRKNESLLNTNQMAYISKTQKKIVQFKKFFEEMGINFNYKFKTEDAASSNAKESETHIDETKCSSLEEDETQYHFGVLEIDTSDGDLQFRIPPEVKTVIKKSKATYATETGKIVKGPRIKKPKNSGLGDSEKVIKHKEVSKRKKTTKSSEKKKGEGKSLGKLKSEKSKPLTKAKKTVVKKKRKTKKALASSKNLKKEKEPKRQNSFSVHSPALLSEIPQEEKISSISISYCEI